MRSFVFYEISINYRFLFFFLGISLPSPIPHRERIHCRSQRSLTAPIFLREAHRILVAGVSISRKLLLSEATTARGVPILLNKLLKSLHRKHHVINKASISLSQVPNNNIPQSTSPKYRLALHRYIHRIKRNSLVKVTRCTKKWHGYSNISAIYRFNVYARFFQQTFEILARKS